MTQKQWVKNQLKMGKKVTSMIAFKKGITRLASIIYRLRNDDKFPVYVSMKKAKNGAMSAEYSNRIR